MVLKPDIVVVGSINVDFVIRSQSLPAPGETVSGGRFEQHGGGKGANQAVAAARLGARVGLIAAVGDDDAGIRAVEDLRSEGIDVSHVVQVAGIATGVALIVVDDAGENQIAVASGANGSLDAEMVESALASIELTEGGVLLTGFEVGDEAIEAAARWAAARGHRTVLDPAPARPTTDAIVACSPLVKPNAGEAEHLTGESDPEAAGRALSRLTKSPVVVTLGANGAIIVEGEAITRMNPYEVSPIDSTGAGDAFSGAFAVGLSDGLTLEDAVQRAQAAAAISTRAEGARAGMTTREVLDVFVATR